MSSHGPVVGDSSEPSSAAPPTYYSCASIEREWWLGDTAVVATRFRLYIGDSKTFVLPKRDTDAIPSRCTNKFEGESAEWYKVVGIHRTDTFLTNLVQSI
jgi:hypothetical protein